MFISCLENYCIKAISHLQTVWFYRILHNCISDNINHEQYQMEFWSAFTTKSNILKIFLLSYPTTVHPGDALEIVHVVTAVLHSNQVSSCIMILKIIVPSFAARCFHPVSGPKPSFWPCCLFCATWSCHFSLIGCRLGYHQCNVQHLICALVSTVNPISVTLKWMKSPYSMVQDWFLVCPCRNSKMGL